MDLLWSTLDTHILGQGVGGDRQIKDLLEPILEGSDTHPC